MKGVKGFVFCNIVNQEIITWLTGKNYNMEAVYSLECQTYLDDNCLASSVYFKNFECGLSSKADPLFGADDDADPDAGGGVGLLTIRLVTPLPLLLVLEATLFGECACDGGVCWRERVDCFGCCCGLSSMVSSRSSGTKCALDK